MILAHATHVIEFFACSDWLHRLSMAFVIHLQAKQLSLCATFCEDKLTVEGWLFTCVPYY